MAKRTKKEDVAVNVVAISCSTEEHEQAVAAVLEKHFKDVVVFIMPSHFVQMCIDKRQSEQELASFISNPQNQDIALKLYDKLKETLQQLKLNSDRWSLNKIIKGTTLTYNTFQDMKSVLVTFGLIEHHSSTNQFSLCEEAYMQLQRIRVTREIEESRQQESV